MNDEYKDFLDSEEWKAAREARMQHDGWACCLCGSTTDLQCHHVSYEDVTALENLRTVCKKCHRDIHEFAEDVKKSSRSGELAVCMNAYNDAMAKIMDKYFVRREATLSEDGDAYMLTKGQQARANKYIHALFEWNPYGPLINYGQRHYCGIGHTRYNNMRLNREHNNYHSH